MNANNDAGHRPEDIEELESLWKQRWLWWVLTWLFLLPGLFFQAGPVKRLKEAKENGDVEAARKEVARMRLVAAISVPIGIVIMVFYFGYGLHRY